MDAVSKLPELRASSTIDNDYILEERKTFPRAYEPWSDQEEILFEKAIEHSNDIDFLSTAFQRNPGNIRSYYKKRKKVVNV